MKYIVLCIVIIAFAVFHCVLLASHETDIKNQLLKQNRTHFLFASDIRVENARVIEYIEKGYK